MRFVLVLLASVLVAPAAAHAAALPKCAKHERARCGSVSVPLHRADPAGPRITVRFRVIPRSDPSRPAGTPIVATEGGPGYSTIESGSSYEFLLGPLRRTHDLILMDNRRPARATTRVRSAAAPSASGRPPTRTAPARPPTTSPPCSTSSASPW